MQPNMRGPVLAREVRLAGLVAYIGRQLSHLAVQKQARLLVETRKQQTRRTKKLKDKFTLNEARYKEGKQN